MKISPAALVIVLFMQACAVPPPVPPPIPPIERPATPQSSSPPAARVRVPAAAPWLADRVSVQFRNLAAPKALALVVPDGLLAFQFDAAEIPVTALPGAVTRMAQIEAICAAADWHWEISGGVVLVSDVETRVWDLAALPGLLTGEVNNQKLQTGGGRSAVDLSIGVNSHETMVETLRSLLASERETRVTTIFADETDSGREYTTTLDQRSPETNVTLLTDTGQIAATASPSLLNRMEAVIKAHREAASRRVALEFVLFEVNVSGREDRKLDLNALRNAGTSLGLDVKLPATAPTGSTGDLTITLDNDSRSKGSELVFHWLETQGDTTVEVRKNVVALHNQPTVLGDVETRRYISEVTIQQQVAGPTGTTSPSVEIEEVNTGETWSVVAAIGDGEVLVRLASGRARLLELLPFSVGDGIEGSLPRTALSSFEAPIYLRDGETRVITDLSSQIVSSSVNRSPLIDWLAPWGRGVNKQDTRIETVITMTATIL